MTNIIEQLKERWAENLLVTMAVITGVVCIYSLIIHNTNLASAMALLLTFVAGFYLGKYGKKPKKL